MVACCPKERTQAFSLESTYFTHCLMRIAKTSQPEQETVLSATEAAVTLLESMNGRACGHSSEVAFIAIFLARHLKLPCPEQTKIRLAALLHDLGKIKKEAYIGEHAQVGADIIRCNPQLTDIAEMVLHHHAEWQGEAPSTSLTGDSIPLGARIIAVANAFQKVFSQRKVNHESSDKRILEWFHQQAGSVFDPAIVKIVLDNYHFLSKFVVICLTDSHHRP